MNKSTIESLIEKISSIQMENFIEFISEFQENRKRIQELENQLQKHIDDKKELEDTISKIKKQHSNEISEFRNRLRTLAELDTRPIISPRI